MLLHTQVEQSDSRHLSEPIRSDWNPIGFYRILSDLTELSLDSELRNRCRILSVGFLWIPTKNCWMSSEVHRIPTLRIRHRFLNPESNRIVSDCRIFPGSYRIQYRISRPGLSYSSLYLSTGKEKEFISSFLWTNMFKRTIDGTIYTYAFVPSFVPSISYWSKVMNQWIVFLFLSIHIYIYRLFYM